MILYYICLCLCVWVYVCIILGEGEEWEEVMGNGEWVKEVVMLVMLVR